MRFEDAFPQSIPDELIIWHFLYKKHQFVFLLLNHPHACPTHHVIISSYNKDVRAPQNIGERVQFRARGF